MNTLVDPQERARSLRQLDQTFGDRTTRSFHAPAGRAFELRAAAGQSDANQRTFTGYACVTGYAYDIYGGPANGGWTETVVRGAFAKTLAERCDTNFLINHEGMSLARTKSGTLTLTEDEQGLAVEAMLDIRMAEVASLEVAMSRGDIDEMSFAFRIIRQRWTNAQGEEVPYWDIEGVRREILEVSLSKGDVSVVNYGASDATTGAMRDADFAMLELRSGQFLSQRSLAFLQSIATPIATSDPAPEDRAPKAKKDDEEDEPPKEPAPEVERGGYSLDEARAMMARLGIKR